MDRYVAKVGMGSDELKIESVLNKEEREKELCRSSRKRYTDFCFTLNNYDDLIGDVTLEQRLIEQYDNKKFTYLFYGYEVAPNTGTPHLQGFFRLRNPREAFYPKHLESICKYLDMFPRLHLAVQKGSYDQNKAYCSKGSKTKEYGSMGQGSRTDLKSAVELLQGSGIEALVDERPDMYVKYHSGFDKLDARINYSVNKHPAMKVIWLYGSSGSGKSYRAKNNHPSLDCWVSRKDEKFWQNYKQQPVVIFDDFRASWCAFNVLLKILDKELPYNVDIKYSSMFVSSEYIYITSIFPPDECYFRDSNFDKTEPIYQLVRRLDKILYIQDWYQMEDVTQIYKDKYGPVKNKVLSAEEYHRCMGFKSLRDSSVNFR